VHVTGDAELAGMAGGAAGGDPARSGRWLGQSSMSGQRKVRLPMRIRLPEVGDLGGAEPSSVPQRHMAGGACRVWNGQVRSRQLVAVEAIADDRVLHVHALRSPLGVTGRTASDDGAV